MSLRNFLRRPAAALAVAAIAATTMTACSTADDAGFVVAGGASPSMRVAAALYAGAIARTGIRVEVRIPNEQQDRDGRLLDEVAQGDIDLFPAFTGDLLGALTPRPEAVETDDVISAVSRALPAGVAIGDPAAVDDRPQLLVATRVADASSATDAADCRALPAGRPVATTDDLRNGDLGALADCLTGPVTSGLTADEVVDRVRSGRWLGVVTGLQSAGALTGHDDVIALRSGATGPRAQNLVPVFVSAAVGKSQLKALSRVAGALTVADLAEMSERVEQGADPKAVAADWLVTASV